MDRGIRAEVALVESLRSVDSGGLIVGSNSSVPVSARFVRDDGECRGLRINRRAIENAKAIDGRAAVATKRVRGGLSKLS
jgi:hypothetical protein